MASPLPPPLPVSERTPWRIWHFLLALVGGLFAGNFAFAMLALDPTAGLIDAANVSADELFALVIPAQHLGTLAVIGVMLAVNRTRASSGLGFEMVGRDLLWVAVGVGLALGLALISLPLSELLGIDDAAQSAVDEFGQVSSGLPLLAAVITLTVLTPITEEVLYRGVLQRALSRRFSVVPLVVVSALVFGAVHLFDVADGSASWLARATIVFVPITVVGAVLSWVTVANGWRLGRAIFIHAGFNLLAVVALLCEQAGCV